VRVPGTRPWNSGPAAELAGQMDGGPGPNGSETVIPKGSGPPASVAGRHLGAISYRRVLAGPQDRTEKQSPGIARRWSHQYI